MPVARNRTAGCAGLGWHPSIVMMRRKLSTCCISSSDWRARNFAALEIRRVVQPVTDLDAGHFAVQELIEHPLEERLVSDGVERLAPEVEGHLLARQQHEVQLSSSTAEGAYASWSVPPVAPRGNEDHGSYSRDTCRRSPWHPPSLACLCDRRRVEPANRYRSAGTTTSNDRCSRRPKRRFVRVDRGG